MRPLVSGVSALSCLVLTACSPLAVTFVPVTSTADGGLQRACGAGFVSPDGLRCDPVLPAEACPAGTMARLGSEQCVAVGWATCPAGFARAPSGWGCLPVLPPSPCPGATRAQLGATGCQPVGDCLADFPPAGATLFVDPSVVVDATHFRTLTTAVAAAPAGAIVAVAPGTYRESLIINRPLTLVGRCAESVELQSTGANVAGLQVRAGGALVLRRFTVRGHQLGLWVSGGGSAEVRDCALLSNRDAQAVVEGATSRLSIFDSVLRDGVPQTSPSWGRGVMAQDGATLALEGVSLEHNQAVAVLVLGPATTAHLNACVVRDTAPSTAGDGVGLVLEGSVRVEVSNSAFLGNRGQAISVKEGALTLTQSLVADTLPRPSGQTGFGLAVSRGGSADVSQAALTHNRSLGLSLEGAGSRVSLTDVVVNETQPSDFGEMGLEATGGTTLVLLRTAVVDNVSVGLGLFGGDATLTQSLVGGTRGNLANAATGLNLQDGARLEAHDSAFIANQSLGILISETSPANAREHVFTGSLVMDTVPLPGGGPGRGVSVQDGLVTFDDSVLAGNSEVAVFLRHPGARVRATDSVLLRTALDPTGLFGFGVVARDGARWESTNTDVRGHAAVGLAFSNASGSIDRGLIADQPIALAAQDGASIAAVRTVGAQPTPGLLEVSNATVFLNNGTKVGEGNIPLPAQ